MKKIDKRIIWIGAGVITFLMVALSATIWIKNSSRQAAEPVVYPTQIVVPTRILSPTPSPTVTHLALLGNIWVVTKVGPEKIKIGNYSYLLANFSNLNQSSLIITRHCGAPTWPTPEVGHKYYMNDFGVLVPVEGVDSPLQRFYPIE